jgi:CDP-diacylglycerol--glycerol-3-phosphate 3-phosphatidyltransferase
MQAGQTVETKERRTFTDTLRLVFGNFLKSIGNLLNSWGIHPNMLTTLGLVGTAIGAIFVGLGNFTVGGLIIMLMGPVDALDGAVARARVEPEDFGAFVDSVTDRYIELAIFGGLLWYYIHSGNIEASLLVFLAASGSVMVSYVRARAQSLGFEAKVGILTRVERFLVIGPSILFNIPLIGVAVVALFANITAIQRIIHVRRQARSRRK